jgi:serine/threonine protein kinase/Tol biopolymer transport system component
MSTLKAGTCIAQYEITSPIGAGGMGEVYRARDTNLGRDVAIKSLPPAFAYDSERLARFEREAQVLASLNHPNIAMIHGLAEAGASKYLVLELVEGDTLAARIARGPLPLDEALDIAGQIAEALEAAHGKGIVHRDLKPSNIKIDPNRRVKVLDFGLAKIMSLGTGGAGMDLSKSPTLTAAQTDYGAILGTAAYMSPEQARGKEVDRRADIWAFGCVLFEMLTGRQAFPNKETAADTLASILVNEPDWQALPAGTPAKIRTLLERCLRKDERRRWADIANVRVELLEALTEREASTIAAAAPAVAPSRRREIVSAALALLFLVTSAAVLWLIFRPEPATPPLRMEIIPPAGANNWTFSQAELSPDGRKLAFLATREGKKLIWVRPLDSSDQALPSTEGAGDGIFWSSDSQFIGFSAEGKLKKAPADGGPAQVIANLPTTGAYVGAWNADGVVLLGSETAQGGPLLRVSASGGQTAPLTELDKSRKEIAHAYPSFLPDGQHYLFLARTSDPQNPAAAYVGDLDSKDRRSLPGIASEAKYSATGHLVFIRDGALMAQQFDAKQLELSGEAFPIADAFVPARTAISGPFSVSARGELAYYVPTAGGAIALNTDLTWYDRKGKSLGVAGTSGEYANPELSPDGKFVAFGRGSPSDIWVLDIGKGLTSRLTSDPAADTYPKWSPDGRTIAFTSDREGTGNLYTRVVGVVGSDKVLFKDDMAKSLCDWSRDGKYLAYVANGDVWALPLSGELSGGKPVRVTETAFTEYYAQISPDSRWIAYDSNETGRREAYIQSFPQPGFKQQVSTAGGMMPRWSRDGRELYYFTIPPNWVVAAASTKPAGASLDIGAPVPLVMRPTGATRDYSVSADGRFLLQVPPGSSDSRGALAGLDSIPVINHIVVLFNWTQR